MATTLPSDLVALAEKEMAEWLGALGLPQLLPLMDEWGADHPEDLAHLEAAEIAQLEANLKLVQKRKLQKALQAIRLVMGVDEPPPLLADCDAQPEPESAPAQQQQPPPPAPRLTADEVARHAALLRSYAGGGDVVVADALRSLHAAWSGCVADPTLRNQLLPSLFAIAKRDDAGAVEREAALALIFLAFSLSGTIVKVDESDEPSTPTKTPAPECVVLILGWLGSGADDFRTVSEHYHRRYPRCKVVTTVGGNDRWARCDSPADPLDLSASTPPSLYAEGAAVTWPADALCEEQLWALSQHILPKAPNTPPPRVLFHLFSNNGFMLYARLLRHLHERAAAGESACEQAMMALRGVVFDSTPDPAYDPPLLKQVRRILNNAFPF